MIKIRQIKFKKIKKILEKLPRVLGEHTFLTFLGLLFTALISGIFVFYQCGILAKPAILKNGEQVLEFDDELHQKILKEWQDRNEKFLNINLKQYPDPFLGLTK